MQQNSNKTQIYKLFYNTNLATLDPTYDPIYGVVYDGAIITCDDQIKWLGKYNQAPADLLKLISDDQKHNLNGYWLTPGFIDCHTHTIFAGSRVDDFIAKIGGMSYEKIAMGGGGINYTVQKTRQASKEQLYNKAEKYIKQFIQNGVTTLEIKSGYGLDFETEKKILQVARQLGANLPIDIKTSYLGAHLKPAEFLTNSIYIDYIIHEVLPNLVAENLVDFVDAFCDNIAFNTKELQELFHCASRHKLPIKLHTEQLSNSGGARLAGMFSAVSVDHLEYLDDDSIRSLKGGNTVAVLLPGAFYYLRQSKKPPVAKLRSHGIKIAIATDFNPGSSPCLSLPLIMNQACTLFKMAPIESMRGVTKHAAQALNLKDRGELKIGYKADFSVWDIQHPDEISYYFGHNFCKKVIKDGKIIYE